MAQESRSRAAGATGPDADALSLQLGVELDPELVVLALTHRSYAYENGGLPTNERLEFLGDSVLGVVITEALYRTHPDLPEGRLAKLRASIVNMYALAGVGRAMGLGAMLRLGKGEELTGGRDKPSIVSDAVEAVLGAVHLQYGLEVSRQVVHRLFDDLLVRAPQMGAGLDWKTSLQELSAASSLGVPEYRITDEGPDHAKVFAATVFLAGIERGAGSGRTKKEAEQQAAALAYTSLSDGADAEKTADDVTPVVPAEDPTALEPAALEPAAVEPGAAASGAARTDASEADAPEVGSATVG